jgi:ParB-like chromosome segregation protein Spo0J
MPRQTGYLETGPVRLDQVELDGEWWNDREKERSLAAEGQITPVIGWYNDDGKFKIADGNRRIFAMRVLGWDVVAADIYDCELNAVRAALAAAVRSSNDMATASLIKRADLDAEGLLAVGNINKAEADRLRALMKLPREIRDAVESGKIKISAAKWLLKLPDAKTRNRAWKEAQKSNDDRKRPRKTPTVDDVKTAVRRVRGELQPQMAISIPDNMVIEVDERAYPVDPVAIATGLERLKECFTRTDSETIETVIAELKDM